MTSRIKPTYFPVDRILQASEICNFKREQETLREHAKLGHCVRLIGPRNFGKTSLVKSVVAPFWKKSSTEIPHLFIYADLYAVSSEQDFSIALVKAFNDAVSAHASMLQNGLNLLKSLKNLRPTWSPPTDGSGYGNFSVVTANSSEHVVPFELLFENIGALHRDHRFKVMLVMDEFQEISHVAGLEGKLRNCLQMLGSDLPIFILGSKHHLLAKIFESPKRPFYKWGFSIELTPIEYGEYHSYMQERFDAKSKRISLKDAIFLQDCMKRVPESINRLCEYLLNISSVTLLDQAAIITAIHSISEDSQSIYSHLFSKYSTKEREVLTAVATNGIVAEPTGKQFLSLVPQISKSQIPNIFKCLIDDGIISMRSAKNLKTEYYFEDAFLEAYIKRYHVFSIRT